MKKNMGSSDRLIRTGIALVFAIFYFTGVVSGTLGLILMIIAAVFLLTSLFGACPLYSLLGIKTCKTSQEPK